MDSRLIASSDSNGVRRMTVRPGAKLAHPVHTPQTRGLKKTHESFSSLDSRIQEVGPIRERARDIAKAIASSIGDLPGSDGDHTSDIRVPLKPKPHVGSGAIALPLPEDVEESPLKCVTASPGPPDPA